MQEDIFQFGFKEETYSVKKVIPKGTESDVCHPHVVLKGKHNRFPLATSSGELNKHLMASEFK